MAHSTPIQTSFNGGEISPKLYGRVDLNKYSSSCRTLKNFIVTPQGAIYRRSGTRFVLEQSDSSKRGRVVPFVFSDTQAYILLFEENLIRVFKDEGVVQAPTNTFVDGDVDPSDDSIRIAGHRYVDGQGPFRLTTTGTLPAGLATGTDYYINKLSGASFTLSQTVGGGSAEDITGAAGGGTHTIAPQGTVPVEVVTTYSESEIMDLHFAQSADTLYIAHASHAPAKLTRTDHDQWTLADIDFLDGPYNEVNTTNVTLNPSSATGESAPTYDFETSDVDVNDDAIEIDDHGYNHEDGPVRVSSTGTLPAGLSAATDYWIDKETGEGGEDEIGLAATKGGTRITITDKGSGTHTIGPEEGSLPTLTALDDVFASTDVGRVVRLDHSGTWGYAKIRAFTDARNVDIEIVESFGASSATTSWRLGAWYGGNYPRTVSFFEQRLYFASDGDNPQTIYGSKVGSFENFEPSESNGTIADDSAVRYTIAADDVNVMRWLSALRSFVGGTSSAIWTIQASSTLDPVTPSNIQMKRSSVHGASTVQPVNVDDQAIYVSDTQRKVFSVGYSFDRDAFISEDLTLLADHISRNGIDYMDYQHEPQSIIWAVRSDGVLLGLTYVREQQVFAWHRHEIGGSFQAVTAAISSVNTTTNTITTSSAHGFSNLDGPVRAITTGTMPSPLKPYNDYYVVVVDSDELQLAYDAKGNSIVDLTDGGSGNATYLELGPHAVVESVASIPAPSGDPSSVDRTNIAHDQIWLTVKRTINSSTVRYVEFFEDAFSEDDDIEDAYMVDCGITYNSTPTLSIAGVDHLEGEIVQILRDGELHGNMPVTSGAVVLTDSTSKAHIGLPFYSEFQTLNLNLPDPEGTAQGKKKRIHHMGIRLHRSLGGYVGKHPENPTYEPLALGETATSNPGTSEALAIFSGDHIHPYDAGTDRDASVRIRQIDPVPMMVLALMPQVDSSRRS